MANDVTKDMTAKDALAKWDANELVWTVEMGGMGPGYEQAIQIMVFEFLRGMVDNPPPVAWDAVTGSETDTEAVREHKRKLWREYTDKIENLPRCKAAVSQIKPSGAQFGAAMNLAAVMAHRDYHDTFEKVPMDRQIIVRRQEPTLTGEIKIADTV